MKEADWSDPSNPTHSPPANPTLPPHPLPERASPRRLRRGPRWDFRHHGAAWHLQHGCSGRCTGRGWQPSLAAWRSPRLLLHGRRSSHAVRRKTDLLFTARLATGLRLQWPLAVGGRLSTGHLLFVWSTRRQQPPRSTPGQRPGTFGRGPPSQSDEHRRQSISSPYPRLVDPSGSRLGLRQHRLRGVQGGRRPPCSGCVVVSPASVLYSVVLAWHPRSMLDARSFMISTLRSQVGFAGGPLRMPVSASRVLSSSGLWPHRRLGRYASATRAYSFRRPPSSAGRGERSTPGLRLFLRLLSRSRFRPSRGRAGVSLGFGGWL